MLHYWAVAAWKPELRIRHNKKRMDVEGRNTFIAVLTLSQGLAIAMVVLVVVWTSSTLDGYAWDGSLKEFNLHPLCMICGFILLYGEAILVYRVFREHEKRLVKLIHGLFHLVALISLIVGLVAVFQFHNAKSIPNMYSVHSWCGLTTALLFCAQFIFGLAAFILPGMTTPLKRLYLPVHTYFGLAILFMAVITVVSGINEKLFFVFKNYSELPHGAAIGNSLGMVTLGYVLTLGFIVSYPDWKRRQGPEAEPLSVHFRPVSSHGETDEE